MEPAPDAGCSKTRQNNIEGETDVKGLVRWILPAALLLASLNAHAARVMFGDRESIRYLAKTEMKAPGGQEIYLGNLVVMRTLVLPYFVESKGLVLGIKGDSQKYIPLPQGQERVVLQAAGLLPEVLPSPRLTALDYLFGFSLEIAVLLLALYTVLKRASVRRRG